MLYQSQNLAYPILLDILRQQRAELDPAKLLEITLPVLESSLMELRMETAMFRLPEVDLDLQVPLQEFRQR